MTVHVPGVENGMVPGSHCAPTTASNLVARIIMMMQMLGKLRLGKKAESIVLGDTELLIKKTTIQFNNTSNLKSMLR